MHTQFPDSYNYSCQLYGALVISYAAIIINMISLLCGAGNFMK